MRDTTALAVILTYVVTFQLFAILLPANHWLAVVIPLARLGIFGWVAWHLVVRVQLLGAARRRAADRRLVETDRVGDAP
jgi:hypothetical protein